MGLHWLASVCILTTGSLVENLFEIWWYYVVED